jgi:hypothetical protein
MTLVNKTCQRCGASAKEAPLTRSHAPRESLWKQPGVRGVYKIYILCRRCHDVYSQMEVQIIKQACEAMKLKHAQYVSQNDR